MKKFSFLGMAFMAVFMCVNLTSCSSSEDDPTNEKEEVVVKEKKMVEMTKSGDGYKSTWVYKFSYNTNGELSQISHNDENYYYNWIDNNIKVSHGYNKWVCTLADKRITEIYLDEENNSQYNYRFDYNSSKELIEYTQFWRNNNEIDTDRSYKWENGGITSFTSKIQNNNPNEESYTITYGNVKNKGWWYPDCTLFGMDIYIDIPAFLFMAHPSLLGKQCTYLPKKITGKYYYWDFNFDVNTEGYVEKCTIIDELGDVTIYTYKWE